MLYVEADGSKYTSHPAEYEQKEYCYEYTFCLLHMEASGNQLGSGNKTDDDKKDADIFVSIHLQ